MGKTKVKLSHGDCKVEIKYGTVQLATGLQKKFPKGARTTTVVITLPEVDGVSKNIQAQAVCDTRDQFCRRFGRRAAFKSLLQRDNEQATDKTLESAQFGVAEGTSLTKAAQSNYILNRADRRTLAAIIMPEFYNVSARKAQRDKAIYENLKAKYEKVAGDARKKECDLAVERVRNGLHLKGEPKTVKIEQNIDTVEAGSTVANSIARAF